MLEFGVVVVGRRGGCLVLVGVLVLGLEVLFELVVGELVLDEILVVQLGVGLEVVFLLLEVVFVVDVFVVCHRVPRIGGPGGNRAGTLATRPESPYGLPRRGRGSTRGAFGSATGGHVCYSAPGLPHPSFAPLKANEEGPFLSHAAG